MIQLRSWLNIVPVVRDVLSRFPLSLLFVVCATVVSWVFMHEVVSLDKGTYVKFYLTTGFGFVGFASFKLFVESAGWSFKKYVAGSIVLILLILFYSLFLYEKTSFSSFIFVSIALLSSLLFSPYLKRQSNMNSVWYFNYQTGVAIFFAAAAATVLGGGLSLILVSVGYLFEADISSKLYGDVWIFAWGGLFPVYVLANLSKAFDFEDENCSFPKGINFIANYILTPLMFAYMAILYAYVIKIVFQWELPKGNLGWMVTSFGAVGVATKLLAYPIRDKGTRLMRWFDQYFYFALIVPVVILFVAIGFRISDYGVTEQRYAVVMLGLWFVVLILMSVRYKEKFHIKYVPMVLTVLALVASAGPWGASQVSLNSQLTRFESLLLKNKLLVNGQVIKSVDEISFEDRKSLSSIADYLSSNKWRSRKVRPLFKDLLAEEENFELSVKEKISARQLLALVDIDHMTRWQARQNEKVVHFNYKNNQDYTSELIDVSGYDFVARNSVYIYKNNTDKNKLKLTRKDSEEEITVMVKNDILSITRNNGERIEFDLEALVLSLRKEGVRHITVKNSDKLKLIKVSETGGFKAHLVLEMLSGKVKDNKEVTIRNLRYFLMLGFND